MPIINLASTEAEANERGTNVHRIDCNNDGKVIMWTYETHHGLCIQDREMNGYDDSDFMMLIWNPETQEPYEICFASTRGWSYPCYGSSPDATSDVMEAYNAWTNRRIAQSRKAEAERLARTPDKGKTIRVVRGRKVPVGTEGLCFWIGPSQFGVRVGIESDGAKYFTAIQNVEVVRA